MSKVTPVRGKMHEGYFDQKKAFAIEGCERAIARLTEASNAIKSAQYNAPNLSNPKAIHDTLKAAIDDLNDARRNFEKARWAATETDLSFDEWLSRDGHEELLFD